MIITSPKAWKAWAQTFPQRAASDVAYQSPFRIVNKTAEAAEILIYDQIGRDFWTGDGMAANDFANLLSEIDPKADLTIGINSPGGNVWDGLAIYNMLLARSGNVITRNDGMAASIASVILQAGSQRHTNSAAMVMIHRAWGLMIGNADDAETFRKELEKHDQVIAGVYASRSGKNADDMLALMAAETFFTGDEAKTAGLVDTVLAAKTGANNHLTAQPNAVKPGSPLAAAGIKPTQQGKKMNEPTPAPAAPTPPANNVIDLDPVIAAINGLKDSLKPQPMPGVDPVATPRVENLGNPLVEKYNGLRYDRSARAKLVTEHYSDLRKELFAAAGISGININSFDRFDYRNPAIMNANTIDSALANTILSNEFVTTMRTYCAPLAAFTRMISPSPVSKRQVIEVPLVSSVGSMQTNATNYETGDSVEAPIAVTVSERSKSFHVARGEQHLGLQLAALVPTNAKVLGEGIHALVTALMTNANYGADNVIGAAANFDSGDLPQILALGKNFDRVTLLLDGGHLAYLLPASRESFTFGEPGAYGFDGGIYKNNLWTSGATDICGFLCGPDAIVTAWGAPSDLPAGEAISTATVDVNGLPFQSTVWFSRASRAIWGSFQIMFGCAAGDTTQGKVLTTQ